MRVAALILRAATLAETKGAHLALMDSPKATAVFAQMHADASWTYMELARSLRDRARRLTGILNADVGVNVPADGVDRLRDLAAYGREVQPHREEDAHHGHYV